MQWINLSNSGAAQYPSDGKGGSTATEVSSRYAPSTITFAGQPSDTNTVRVTGYFGIGYSYSTQIFEFDNTGAITAGRVSVTIGATLADTLTNLVTAINATDDCGFTASTNGTDRIWLYPKVKEAASVGITHTKSGANITVALSATSFTMTKRIVLIGFQPRNTAAAAAGTVAVANHSGSTQITLPAATTGSENLPYIPLGITLDGFGLKVTPGAAAVQGTLFFDEV